MIRIVRCTLAGALSIALLTTTLAGQGVAPAGTVASSVPAPIASLLAGIRARDSGQLAVSEEDGRFLRLLIASSRTKRALEIGDLPFEARLQEFNSITSAIVSMHEEWAVIRCEIANSHHGPVASPAGSLPGRLPKIPRL